MKKRNNRFDCGLDDGIQSRSLSKVNLKWPLPKGPWVHSGQVQADLATHRLIFWRSPVRIRCAVASDAVWRCMEEGLIDWCSMIARAGIDAGFASVDGACDGLIEQAAQQVPAPVWVSVAET